MCCWYVHIVLLIVHTNTHTLVLRSQSNRIVYTCTYINILYCRYRFSSKHSLIMRAASHWWCCCYGTLCFLRMVNRFQTVFRRIIIIAVRITLTLCISLSRSLLSADGHWNPIQVCAYRCSGVGKLCSCVQLNLNRIQNNSITAISRSKRHAQHTDIAVVLCVRSLGWFDLNFCNLTTRTWLVNISMIIFCKHSCLCFKRRHHPLCLYNPACL